MSSYLNSESQERKQEMRSLESYHSLCTSLQQKYEVQKSTTPGQPIQLRLDFSAYTPYELRPANLYSRPFPDGMVDPWEVTKHHEHIKTFSNISTLASEGFLSYVECKGFFDIVLGYNGPLRTSGNERWDEFFASLKANGYKRRLVPCMVRPSASFHFKDQWVDL